MLRYWLPHSHMYLLNLAQLSGTWCLHPQVCQHLPSGLKMFLCVSETSTKFGAWGPNRCWDIDFPTPLCICSTWPSYQVPMLHPWVCQHLPSSLKCSYVSQKPPKNLVHGALLDAEILTSPLPHVFAQPGQDLGTDALACRCANTSKVV